MIETSGRKALIKCHLILMKELPPIGKLLDVLYQEEVFNSTDIDRIMSIDDIEDRKRKFLIYDLPRGRCTGTKTFETFCHALEYVGRSDLSKILRDEEAALYYLNSTNSRQ